MDAEKFVQITNRLAVPQKYQAMHRWAMTGKGQGAISVGCLMCMGWQAGEVNRCTASHCPPYPYRSGTQSSKRRATPCFFHNLGT